jgi:hypothetical protein
MTEDLKMTGDDYNVALFTFFITYILFEVRLSFRIVKTSLCGERITFKMEACWHHPTSYRYAILFQIR